MPESPIRVLIVDDEPLARAFARQRLAALGDVEVVGECDNGDDLAEAVKSHRPNVLLVDIRMPGADVFETLRRLFDEHRPMPYVIFATAYDSYALRAFEANAVDYLVKPYTQTRLMDAFARVQGRTQSSARIRTLAGDLGPSPARLLVPDGSRFVPVPLDAIVWLQAEDDFVRLHTKDRSYLLSRSMTELEDKLDPTRFMRVHRSAIVQTSRIRAVRRAGSGRLEVQLEGGPNVMVSRSNAHKLGAWMV